jgi:hypothetical protein
MHVPECPEMPGDVNGESHEMRQLFSEHAFTWQRTAGFRAHA